MALTRSDGLLYAIGQGYSALDAEAARNRLDGFAVVSGLAVTVSSGLTLSIASGTATVGETSNTVDTVSLGSSTTVTLNAADSTNPRKDTVYIDTSGTVQVETGTAEAYDPSDETLFDTFQPEPPLPSTEGVILAEVVVPAGASSINTTDHVRDRRQPAQAVFDEVACRSVFTDSLSPTRQDYGPGWEAGIRLADDWEDNQLTSDRQSADPNFRPAWTVDSGSPSATGGVLELSAGDSTAQTVSIPSLLVEREWSITYKFDNSVTTGSFVMEIIYGGDSDRLLFGQAQSGTVRLAKDNGTFTDLITGSQTEDTNEHTIRATRSDDGEFELFYDGTSQGTATDTFLPSIDKLRILSTLDTSMEVRHMSVV